SPCVYYGDEAGLEGFEDPFNRGGFPWGREDADLTDWYAKLGGLRRELAALQTGDIEYLAAKGPLLAFARVQDKERAVALTNAGPEPVPFETPWPGRRTVTDAMTGAVYPVKNGVLTVTVPGETGMLLTAVKKP
ncbi:MAG: glycoside hydrolase family 13 protein, partial [Oscillospiraceae bacterium]|nr:glycoside hydrolase family 13 protein [Oscillospiraceae bacterium]